MGKVAKIFHPLGLVSLFVVQAKILIQDLWTMGVGWDDPVTQRDHYASPTMVFRVRYPVDILDHFYWPNLRKDVVEYCKSCLAQMVGKPNQTIRKAPLQSPPVIQEPFSRIIVDCVGPLPKTRSGNQYLVTIHARIHQIS